MALEIPRKFTEKADVVWLCGGNTPVQMEWLRKYELIPILQKHKGVFIGLSAGAINLAETSVCSLTCRHLRQAVYPGLGCIPISPESHFRADPVSEDLLELSKTYPLCGMESESTVFYQNGNPSFFGRIYKPDHRQMMPVSTVGSPLIRIPE